MKINHRIFVLMDKLMYNECKPEGLPESIFVRSPRALPAMTAPAQLPLGSRHPAHSPAPCFSRGWGRWSLLQ